MAGILKFDMSNAERNFAAAVDKMSKLTGLDPKKILLAEAGSILKRCFAKTPRPPADAQLVIAGRLKALRALQLTGGKPGTMVTINAGKRAPYGRVFLRTKKDRFRRTHDDNFRPLNQHYKDADWELLQNSIHDAKIAVAKVVPQKRAAAGLARQSWDLIAQSLGIRLESVPGGAAVSARALQQARNARVPGDKQRNNGTSRIDENNGKLLITLINRLPYGPKIGFEHTLAAAMAGRAKYMETAIAKGFNGSIEQTARLFPGWTVKTG
ncbi:MAG: hypothetical protein JSR30_00080 [Proteobacteria bacterium]|nr:hypothetical protein [Pseudomonadota bacterium]